MTDKKHPAFWWEPAVEQLRAADRELDAAGRRKRQAEAEIARLREQFLKMLGPREQMKIISLGEGRVLVIERDPAQRLPNVRIETPVQV